MFMMSWKLILASGVTSSCQDFFATSLESFPAQYQKHLTLTTFCIHYQGFMHIQGHCLIKLIYAFSTMVLSENKCVYMVHIVHGVMVVDLHAYHISFNWKEILTKSNSI